MKLFCYGDSNTYGYDARSRLGERLPKEERWTDILAALSGWEVINCGMNGRKIPQDSWLLRRFDEQLAAAEPVELLLIMLGTNDLLSAYFPEAGKAADAMEGFLCHILEHPALDGHGNRLLLLAPPLTDIGRFGGDGEQYDRECVKLGVLYRQLARQYDLWFADAGSWELPLAHDGVHLSPEGNRRMAEHLLKWLQEVWQPGV